MRPRRSPLCLEQLESRELLDATAFPNTSSTIGIISDQLNTGLSNPLIQFIATHMDGTQKLTADYNQQFRNYNPQWVLLYYKLATEAGPAQYIIDNQWGSDWNTVNANESWFMHNASGQRLTNSSEDWDQLDPTNTAWQQYWLNQVETNIQESGAQGVFADVYEAGMGGWWYDEYDARFAGTNSANPASWPGGVTWLDQLQNLANVMQQGLNTAPGAPLYIPNVDALVTGWDTINYAQLPAAFAENFGEWGPSYLDGQPSDWVMAMNRALSLTDQNKVFIMQPYLHNDPNSSLGLLQRGFDLGSYLLIKSDHTYINMGGGFSPSDAYYYPEYTINLGSALAPPATDVSQYLWNNVYRRDFQNGIVLVNPSDTTYTITLPQTYALVNFQGGGALSDSSLDSTGHYIGGDLSTTAVNTVTLVSGQTAILMNPSLLPSAPTGLSATSPSTSQINLSWNPVSGATSYWVERSSDDTNWQVLATMNGSTTTYADTGLPSATTYYYRVVAGNSVGNSSYSNVAGTTTQAQASAAFVKVDSSTQGNWQGVYGSQGYNVIDNAVNYPSYATVSASGNLNAVWSTSTTDPRALQDASGSGRTAACWVSTSSFNVNVNITDGQTHQLALYLLDWDQGGARSERVDILNAATGSVLSSQTVSGFQNGKYLVWNVSGNVVIRITNLDDPNNLADNAVLSGLFIDPAALNSSASFVKSDTTTEGNWQGVYGSQGYNVINNAVNYPSYATVSATGNANAVWSTSTTDPRALQDAVGSGRIAACWVSASSFNVNVNITDGQAHQLALYLLDWDQGGTRSERVDIIDAATGIVLSTQTVSGFQNGEYLVWNVSGDIDIRITNLDNPNNTADNAVLSGLFFDPTASGSSATFLKSDTTTQGNWQGVYGSQGYNVVDNAVNYPSYATVSASGNLNAIWSISTTDPRALQDVIGSGRTAACWVSYNSFNVNVNLTDGKTHQLALYLLDWDQGGARSERVDILDATTGHVLNTQTMSGFQNGKYLVWNVSGNVIVRITNLDDPNNLATNAVLSGLFFDPAG